LSVDEAHDRETDDAVAAALASPPGTEGACASAGAIVHGLVAAATDAFCERLPAAS